MTKTTRLVTYSILTLGVFVIDRLTKALALCKLSTPVTINPFLSFELALNRGISGGLFHFSDTIRFMLVSSVIVTILIAIIIWTRHAYRRGENIIGQLLIITGGLSNILDRIIYGGVVDFISISFNSWHWALFNIADIAINVGVAILLLQNFLTKDHA